MKVLSKIFITSDIGHNLPLRSLAYCSRGSGAVSSDEAATRTVSINRAVAGTKSLRIVS